jgi:hypothetical protein
MVPGLEAMGITMLLNESAVHSCRCDTTLG